MFVGEINVVNYFCCKIQLINLTALSLLMVACRRTCNNSQWPLTTTWQMCYKSQLKTFIVV